MSDHVYSAIEDVLVYVFIALLLIVTLIRASEASFLLSFMSITFKRLPSRRIPSLQQLTTQVGAPADLAFELCTRRLPSLHEPVRCY
jgi:hypothetical protein